MGRAVQRCRLDRPGPPRPGRRGGPRVTSGPDPGGGHRPAPGGSTAPARTDPAPLPTVIRVLDAGGLDRDPLRWSLRHRADPHRGLRGVHPHDHPARTHGVPPVARIGSGTVAGPTGRRFRGHSRGDQRGLDASAGPSGAQGDRSDPLRLLRVGRRGCAATGPEQPVADELPAARSGRGGGQRRRSGRGDPGTGIRVRSRAGRRGHPRRTRDMC